MPAGWSGSVSLYKIDPTTGDYTIIGPETITNYSLIRASSDRQTIVVSQGDISDGRWGVIDVPSGTVSMRDGYTLGTAWDNYAVDVAKGGTEFAFPTYGGLFIYDQTMTKEFTLGAYATKVYGGVTYSPKNGHLYATLKNSDEIQIFDPTTFLQVGTIHTAFHLLVLYRLAGVPCAFHLMGNGCSRPSRVEFFISKSPRNARMPDPPSRQVRFSAVSQRSILWKGGVGQVVEK